jgi:hypothetical protein
VSTRSGARWNIFHIKRPHIHLSIVWRANTVDTRIETTTSNVNGKFNFSYTHRRFPVSYSTDKAITRTIWCRPISAAAAATSLFLWIRGGESFSYTPENVWKPWIVSPFNNWFYTWSCAFVDRTFPTPSALVSDAGWWWWRVHFWCRGVSGHIGKTLIENCIVVWVM